MKLEKRSDGAPEPSSGQPETPAGKKPVVIYIMILFIAAFLLMALSFFMHQRSNTEALGELQHSVSAMQEVQVSQEKIIELQEEVADLQKKVTDLQAQAEEDAAASEELLQERDTLERQSNALLALYQLQQEYAAKDYAACRTLIANLEAGLADALPEDDLSGGVVSPAQRYQELKAAVEARAD